MGCFLYSNEGRQRMSLMVFIVVVVVLFSLLFVVVVVVIRSIVHSFVSLFMGYIGCFILLKAKSQHTLHSHQLLPTSQRSYNFHIPYSIYNIIIIYCRRSFVRLVSWLVGRWVEWYRSRVVVRCFRCSLFVDDDDDIFV